MNLNSQTTVLICLFAPLMPADSKPLSKEETVKVMEASICKAAEKPAVAISTAPAANKRLPHLFAHPRQNVKK